MEGLPNLKFITMATTSTSTATTITFLFLLLTTMSASVLARPHVRPALTLADLDADGTIPKTIFNDLDSMDAQLTVNDGGLENRGGDFDGARRGSEKLRDVDDGDDDDDHHPGVQAVLNEIQFDAVDLPSHFETYDLNRDRRVSLNELTIVTGTREIDAMKPFRAADVNHDNKISFDEFKNAPWIFGATREVEVVDEFIHELIGEDI